MFLLLETPCRLENEVMQIVNKCKFMNTSQEFYIHKEPYQTNVRSTMTYDKFFEATIQHMQPR